MKVTLQPCLHHSVEVIGIAFAYNEALTGIVDRLWIRQSGSYIQLLGDILKQTPTINDSKRIATAFRSIVGKCKNRFKVFAPIQVFVKKVSEIDCTNPDSLPDIKMYPEKIEGFFSRYRPTPGSGVIYFPLPQTSTNDTTVKTIHKFVKQLTSLPESESHKEFERVKPQPQKKNSGLGHVFIGHGRSKLWARLQIFLNDDLNLKTLTFEDESRTSESIINVLNEFPDKSSIAILVMTADDETAEGKSRAMINNFCA